MIFFSVFVFLFGAVVGSFLNVVILRLNTGQSIVSGRSKCFTCAKKLKWHELLPIVSFVFLRGKCSACKTKISWQYPLVETITGIIFVLLFQQSQISNLKSQNILYFGFWISVFSFLIIIAVYDYRHQIIQNLFVWIFNGLAFLGLFNSFRISDFGFRILDWNALLDGFILFAFFALLWGMSNGRWMGFGAAKLAFGPFMILGTIISFFWGEKIIGFLF